MSTTMELRDEFVVQVRDLLAHLHNYSYCERHPFVARVRSKSASPRERMRALRRVILEGIETLRSGQQALSSSPCTRCYQVLHMHYVEGLMVKEIAAEFDLSSRQVYRYLRKAEEDLAALLEDELASAEPSEGKASDGSRAELVLREAQRLGAEREALPLGPLLSGAIASVTRLGVESMVSLNYAPPAQEIGVLANRQILRQALVGALSYAIQSAPAGTELAFSASQSEGGVRFELMGAAGSAAIAACELPREVRELAESLGARCWTVRQADGTLRHTIAIRLQRRKHILVIDDNEGTLELMRRYLTGTEYDVTGVRDGAEGFRVIEEDTPDAIILDVLLAHQDGWEILQVLQNDRNTQRIPVLICSVYDDPALARSLGAAAFLTKPVHRAQLLETLAALVESGTLRAKSGAAL